MTVSVIIPHFKHLNDLTRPLVDSLRAIDGKYIDEIVLVNDGVFDKDILEYQWRMEIEGLRCLNMPEDVGFLKTANHGLVCAKGDIKILISNDVRITAPFVGRVVGELAANPSALVGHRKLDYDTGWNTFNGKVFPYLEGYFLAAVDSTWNELDYFDPRYSPCDMEDDDLSTTAISQGRSLITISSEGIQHLGAQTIGYNPAREAITIRNKQLFKEKWVK